MYFRRGKLVSGFGEPSWTRRLADSDGLPRYSPAAIKGFLRRLRYFLFGVAFFVDDTLSSSLPSRLRKNVHEGLSTCRVISPATLEFLPPGRPVLFVSSSDVTRDRRRLRARPKGNGRGEKERPREETEGRDREKKREKEAERERRADRERGGNRRVMMGDECDEIKRDIGGLISKRRRKEGLRHRVSREKRASRSASRTAIRSAENLSRACE